MCAVFGTHRIDLGKSPVYQELDSFVVMPRRTASDLVIQVGKDSLRDTQPGAMNSTLWAVSTISSTARVPPIALSVGPDHRRSRAWPSTQEQTSARRSSNRWTVTVRLSGLPRMTLRAQDQTAVSPVIPRLSVTSVT